MAEKTTENVQVIKTCEDCFYKERCYSFISYPDMEYCQHFIDKKDVVSREVLEQIRWERDIAIEQLAEYGVCFGEKKKDLVEVVKCKYCKNGKEEKPYIKKDVWCDVHGKDFYSDEFCNRGERRTDNG